MRIYIYARVYVRSIVYITHMQFTQTNGLTTHTCVYIINASNAMAKPYLYMYVCMHAHTRTRSIANSTRKRPQTHTRKQMQINARKLLIALDVWVISACKYVCILRVRSKTFRMYYKYPHPKAQHSHTHIQIHTYACMHTYTHASMKEYIHT